MFLLDGTSGGFSWHTLLLGEEDWSFLPEVLLRTSIMFIVATITLRIIGKRGIMQDIFELVTIITLGSAAGDPMFYKKVGVLPAILVFITVIALYKLIHYWTSRSKRLTYLVEGNHVLLIKEGKFSIEAFKHTDMEAEQIFADLRLEGISQMGQVKRAYIESSGQISLFFQKDEDVQWGLPIFPEELEKKSKTPQKGTFNSCCFCAYTQDAGHNICSVCNHTDWITSSKEPRLK